MYFPYEYSMAINGKLSDLYRNNAAFQLSAAPKRAQSTLSAGLNSVGAGHHSDGLPMASKGSALVKGAQPKPIPRWQGKHDRRDGTA